jgi:hypothetical protein
MEAVRSTSNQKKEKKRKKRKLNVNVFISGENKRLNNNKCRWNGHAVG